MGSRLIRLLSVFKLILTVAPLVFIALPAVAAIDSAAAVAVINKDN